jgi:putative restriction endonuclease
VDTFKEHAVRAAMFAHLDQLVAAAKDGSLSWQETANFPFENESLPMRQTRGRGIHKPQGLDAALTITTSFTSPGGDRPYEDEIGVDGYQRYRYERTDPNLSTNRGLRAAMDHQLPLAYFIGVAPTRYLPVYPVYVIGDDPSELTFVLGFNSTEVGRDLTHLTPIERAYAYRATRQRLHQPRFRELVMQAYGSTCAVCRLRHSELLDAAHIVEDAHSFGDPVIVNGIALCKIHHAAYDRLLLGIDPSRIVHINDKLLAEVDGPMLLHGLQEMNGVSLHVPRSPAARPDPDRLEIKYKRFTEAA